MSLLDDLRKKLSPENMQTVEDILGDDFDWDLVPRSRLNKVIKQRNELKKQVATPDYEPKLPEDDDDDEGANKGKGSGSSATYSEQDVQKLLQAERAKSAAAEIKYATLSKLQEEKALDADLVFGLLDVSKLSFNDKHEIQGLKEAGLETVKANKPFLFGEAGEVQPGTGKDGGQGGKRGKSGDAVDAAIASIFAGYGVAQEE